MERMNGATSRVMSRSKLYRPGIESKLSVVLSLRTRWMFQSGGSAVGASLLREPSLVTPDVENVSTESFSWIVLSDDG